MSAVSELLDDVEVRRARDRRRGQQRRDEVQQQAKRPAPAARAMVQPGGDQRDRDRRGEQQSREHPPFFNIRRARATLPAEWRSASASRPRAPRSRREPPSRSSRRRNETGTTPVRGGKTRMCVLVSPGRELFRHGAAPGHGRAGVRDDGTAGLPVRRDRVAEAVGAAHAAHAALPQRCGVRVVPERERGGGVAGRSAPGDRRCGGDAGWGAGCARADAARADDPGDRVPGEVAGGDDCHAEEQPTARAGRVCGAEAVPEAERVRRPAHRAALLRAR